MNEAPIIAELREENTLLKQKYELVKQELAQLRRLIYGSKSERFKEESPDQLSLFASAVKEDPAPNIEAEDEVLPEEKKKHPGRGKLPEHLPVEEVICEPSGVLSDWERLSDVITETLDYRPACLFKRRIIRPRYKDPKTGKIHIGQLPDRPLPKAIAEANLLAYITISKFVDHLPLNRLAQIFKREYGWEPSQSTLVNWIKEICKLLKPLYEALIKKVMSSDYIQADESPLKVLEYSKSNGKVTSDKKIMQGYQWVYYSPEQKLVYFNYRKGRGLHGPKEVLKSYNGYVQCDGYKVYDNIAKAEPSITLLGCLAHARRYFEKAKDSDAERSHWVLSQIQTVYRKEAACRDGTMEERQKVRTEEILPILEQIHSRCLSDYENVLPKSQIGKAMYYYNAQWEKIKAAAENPRFQLDNNLIENQIRPLALGRKNFLFAGSHEGAQNIAMLYSLLLTCKQRGINEMVWLKETLEKISSYPVNRIYELLPGESPL